MAFQSHYVALKDSYLRNSEDSYLSRTRTRGDNCGIPQIARAKFVAHAHAGSRGEGARLWRYLSARAVCGAREFRRKENLKIEIISNLLDLLVNLVDRNGVVF